MARVLAAPPERLLRTAHGDTAVVEAIVEFRSAMLHVLRARLSDRPVLANWQALLDYLRAEMTPHPIERVRVLHLDARNMLIRDELISEGTIDEAAVHVRQVIGRALELGSAAIILVHNHPTDDPTPSASDIDLTRRIATAGKPLGIDLYDHLIVSGASHVSLRSQGLC